MVLRTVVEGCMHFQVSGWRAACISGTWNNTVDTDLYSLISD
jgi:hypothetical protein